MARKNHSVDTQIALRTQEIAHKKQLDKMRKEIKHVRHLVRVANGRKNGKDLKPKTLFELASRGLSIKDICDILGVVNQTLYNNPELKQALADGRAARKAAVMDKNFSEAMDGNDKALQRELEMSGAYKKDAGQAVQVSVTAEIKQKDSVELLEYLNDSIEGEFTNVQNDKEVVPASTPQDRLLQAPLEQECEDSIEEETNQPTDISDGGSDNF